MTLKGLEEKLNELNKEYDFELERNANDSAFDSALEEINEEIEIVEEAIFIMKDNNIDSVSSIKIYDIEWDTSDPDIEIDVEDLDLPQEITVPIDLSNVDLLDGIHDYTENIMDRILDTYGFCAYSFGIDIIEEEPELSRSNEEEQFEL